MITHKDKIYVLNPCYQFRDDIYRIVLFAKANANASSSREWHSFIHPAQAGMFSFFTHNRSYEENLRLLAAFFNKDMAYMEKAVSAYIKNADPLYSKWKGHNIYLPKNMLVERDEAGEDFCFSQLSPDSFHCKETDVVSRRLYSGPLLLTFMLTNRCLTHCRYCYADTSTNVRQLLPTSRVLELIQEAAALKVRQINLMGGEIFLHKDWNIILKELVRQDIAPDFISTKIPLSGEHLKQLKETGFRGVIQISLDACDRSLLKETLHVRDTYRDEMMKSIRMLDQSGLRYQISSVLTAPTCNRQTMTELFDFLVTLEHIHDWRINPVSNSITIDYKEFAGLKASKADIEELFDYIESNLQPVAHFPVLLNREAINKAYYTSRNGSQGFKGSTCSALNTHLFILPDGKATICEQLYWNPRFIIGDVSHSGLCEVWNSPRALQLVELSRQEIRAESPCKTCAIFESCYQYQNRCWSDIIKTYGADCWDFPDPRCKFAPTMKNNLGYD